MNLNDSKKKVKHSSITFQQQLELKKMHDENPEMTQADLTQWVNDKYGSSIDRSTVSKILKRVNLLGEKRLENLSLKRLKKVRLPKVDKELRDWFVYYQNVSSITDAMLLEKAKLLAIKHKVPPNELKFSSGWINSFKARHNLKTKSKHSILRASKQVKVSSDEALNACDVMIAYMEQTIEKMNEDVMNLKRIKLNIERSNWRNDQEEVQEDEIEGIIKAEQYNDGQDDEDV